MTVSAAQPQGPVSPTHGLGERATAFRTALAHVRPRTLFLTGLALSLAGGFFFFMEVRGYLYSVTTGVAELGMTLILVAGGRAALERRRRPGHSILPTIAAAACLAPAVLFGFTAVVGFAGGIAGEPGSAHGPAAGPDATPGTPVENGIAEYLDSNWASTAPTAKAGYPRVVGGLVIVDVAKRELMFRGWFDAHPDELADTLEQVRTIALVWTTEKDVGSYTDGASGWRTDYWVRLVDFRTREVLGDGFVRGGDPPASKSGAGDTHGDLPDLMGYVDGLRPEATETP